MQVAVPHPLEEAKDEVPANIPKEAGGHDDDAPSSKQPHGPIEQDGPQVVTPPTGKEETVRITFVFCRF